MPCHFEFRKKRQLEEKNCMKKQVTLKKNKTLDNTFALRDECEKLLMKVPNNFPFNSLITSHFLDQNVTKNLLNAFTKVRMTERLTV